MGEGKGWISVHRKIQYSWLWQEKPFSKGQAWIDLLLSANHKDNKALIGTELINVERGSFVTSQKKLMEKWGWGNTKVRNFLELLKEDGMISYSGKRYTEIKISNYEEYQKQTEMNPDISTSMENERIENKSTTNQRQIENKLRTNTNNNDNKYNNTTTTEKEDKEKEFWVLALEYFCKKSGKLNTQLKPRELEAAQKICSEVPSLNAVLRGIDKAFNEFKPDTEEDKINSFCYCLGPIKDFWKRESIKKKGGKGNVRNSKQPAEYGVDSSGIGFHF
ncbi:hypothetical protein [Clostridium tyrobutyricum]|uniref:hypothetical protein n=1 Tax=Clostridium tyrobutyricum TaxID=1519 RepID=UPI001C3935EC|nr:hypothetical protein [Clostridium tyrobutyricum]MBV4423430.1 hypothetical protein [Clostridium tyrobutyricum]